MKTAQVLHLCLRSILGVHYPERIRNEDLWQRTGQEPVTGEIQRRKLGWLGHVLRRDAGNPTRIALGWNPQGTRKRGRPAHTWRRELDKEMKEMELSWVDLTRKAQDRDEWRAVVRGLYSGAQGSAQGGKA